ncbi:hypothetical protein LXL04_007123 [Taraxacum kok-saghyz]
MRTNLNHKICKINGQDQNGTTKELLAQRYLVLSSLIEVEGSSLGYIASFEDLYEIILQARLKLDTKIKEANEKFPNNLESVNGGQDSMLIMLIRDHCAGSHQNSAVKREFDNPHGVWRCRVVFYARVCRLKNSNGSSSLSAASLFSFYFILASLAFNCAAGVLATVTIDECFDHFAVCHELFPSPFSFLSAIVAAFEDVGVV